MAGTPVNLIFTMQKLPRFPNQKKFYVRNLEGKADLKFFSIFSPFSFLIHPSLSPKYASISGGGGGGIHPLPDLWGSIDLSSFFLFFPPFFSFFLSFLFLSFFISFSSSLLFFFLYRGRGSRVFAFSSFFLFLIHSTPPFP